MIDGEIRGCSDGDDEIEPRLLRGVGFLDLAGVAAAVEVGEGCRETLDVRDAASVGVDCSSCSEGLRETSRRRYVLAPINMGGTSEVLGTSVGNFMREAGVTGKPIESMGLISALFPGERVFEAVRGGGGGAISDKGSGDTESFDDAVPLGICTGVLIWEGKNVFFSFRGIRGVDIRACCANALFNSGVEANG